MGNRNGQRFPLPVTQDKSPEFTDGN